ncbi:MAG: beta-propeller domain-containing protein [Gammaproteobacteria bacterium]|nr:beta-propeller domain-containing protein [Gammaproteobacteria bacterium]NNF60166.1 hypothetical protein [Gammaproteobacteria bacterium]NNM21579.1 hypothetical protein [Gammaproteobacteria bacterium]
MTRSILTSLALVLLLAGCGSGNSSGDSPADLPNDSPNDPPPTGGEPVPNSKRVDRRAVVPQFFADCDAYIAYLTDAFFTSVTQDQPCPFGWCPIDVVAFETPAPAADASASPGDVSQTNTQEPGVDEGDLVEADSFGNVYVLNAGRLVVVDGFPPEQANIIAELQLDGPGYPQEMLLDETAERLVIVGQDYLGLPEPGKPVSNVWIVDISDPAAPVIAGTLQFDGYPLASRRNGSRVHLFTHTALFLPGVFYADNGWELIRQWHAAQEADDEDELTAATAALRQRISASIAAQSAAYLPHATGLDGNAAPLDCADLAAPEIDIEPAFSMISSFDSDGGNVNSAALVNNVSTVYASEGDAYLAQSSRGWWWDPLQADETAVYKYSIGVGAPQFRAAGVVAGQAYNNLHFSEHDGFLRVATNETVFDDATEDFALTNHLFVLRDDDAGNLVVAGAVENFEADEDIFAVRFLGERGYVVTFRQIDPLFSFDLADPLNPRLAGELELPGFSTYMQPVGESHLLTIGRDADADGNVGPLALRIFDVADLAAPRLAHTWILEQSDLPWAGWSPAAYDYRAFNFYAPRGLLSLPYSFYEFDWQSSFNGFVYFAIDVVGGISEIGRINHNDLVSQAYCPDAPENCDYPGLWFSANPLRSIIMTDGTDSYIHTVSDAGLKVTPADDPASVLRSIVLAPGY